MNRYEVQPVEDFFIGDILFLLPSLTFLVLVIGLIVFFIRTNAKRKEQLNRIEKKIDELKAGQ